MSNKPSFMRGNSPPPQQPGQMKLNINVNDLEKHVCGQCGHDRFSQTIFIRYLPALQSPTGKETAIFQPAGVICTICGIHDSPIPESDYAAIQAEHKRHQDELEKADETADDPKS